MHKCREAGAFPCGNVERSFVGLDSLRASARSIRESGVCTLRIGTVPLIATSVMPQAILAFR